MTYICKTVVIVHVDGRRKEIAQGAPLPEGVDEDAMDDLIRLGAIERVAAQADIRRAPAEPPVTGPTEVILGELARAGAAETLQVEGAAAGAAVDAQAEQADAADAKPRRRRDKDD